MTDRTTLRPARRTVLTASVGVGSVLAATALAGGAAAEPAPNPARLWDQATSANGWSLSATISEHEVEGTGLTVPLRTGPTALVLLHLARRFHYEIDELRVGDLTGASRDRRIVVPEQSNHLSGTALAIRRGSYPPGQRGNLFPEQQVVVRDMVAECDGVVRWGGEFAVPMEGHFQIDLPPGDARISRLAQRFSQTDTFDRSGGAGTIDAFAPARRARAARFARAQAQ